MPKKTAAKPRPKSKAKAQPRKRAVARIDQNGEGFMDFLKGANKFLKDTKLISTLAPALGLIPGVGEVAAPLVGTVAGSLGYGKRRPHKKKMTAGRGLNPSGRGLMLAGQRHPYR